MASRNVLPLQHSRLKIGGPSLARTRVWSLVTVFVLYCGSVAHCPFHSISHILTEHDYLGFIKQKLF